MELSPSEGVRSQESALFETMRRARADSAGMSLKVNQQWVVMKFGGSSLQDADCLRQVKKIVEASSETRIAVVCSAMGKTTNMLLSLMKTAMSEGTVDLQPLKDYHYKIWDELMPDECADERNGCETLFRELSDVLQGVVLLRKTMALTETLTDLCLSFGERLSVRIVSQYISKSLKACKHYDAWDLGLLTTSGSGDVKSVNSTATVELCAYEAIGRSLNERANEAVGATPRPNSKFVAIVTGYISKDKHGRVTTLGRDGSDFTATIIGAALCADRVEIYKDVSGVLSADPRLVDNPVHVHSISYEEAAELSYFGAKVVHPAAIEPLRRLGIPLWVKNTMNPDKDGTCIKPELTSPKVAQKPTCQADGFVPKVRAISCKKNVTLVDIESTRMLGQHGFLAKVFDAFKKNEVSIDAIATSDVSITLTLDENNKDQSVVDVCAELGEFADVIVKKEAYALLTLLVPAKDQTTKIMREIFEFCESSEIEIAMTVHGASKVNVGILIKNHEVNRAITGLHDFFFGALARSQSSAENMQACVKTALEVKVAEPKSQSVGS